MDWIHALVALLSATLGAAAHACYAYWARRNYWFDFHLALRHGQRRANSMRKKRPIGRRLWRGRLPDLREFDV